MEFFKGDETEQKIVAAGSPVLAAISLSLDEFFDGAYGAAPLGGIIFDDEMVAVAKAMARDVFIRSFKELFDSWTAAGTFDSYILLFKKIFGDDSSIEFEVPGPGLLNINIIAGEFDENLFVAREIVDNEYVYSEIVDDEGDNIVFTTVHGVESQHDLEKILFTVTPVGILTTIGIEFE